MCGIHTQVGITKLQANICRWATTSWGYRLRWDAGDGMRIIYIYIYIGPCDISHPYFAQANSVKPKFVTPTPQKPVKQSFFENAFGKIKNVRRI